MTAAGVPYHRGDRSDSKHPESLGNDLARLEQHYRDESKRLEAESRRMAEESATARRCADSCRQWRASLTLTNENAAH